MSSTAIVLIDSNVYDVYADESQANAYFAAQFGETWSALSAAQKAQALVTSTRLLDRQCWIGEKVDDAQPLAWPRIGINDSVNDGMIPQVITDASMELAQMIAAGSDVQSVAVQAQKLQAIKAGSVSLTFFRGAEGSLQLSRFPQQVQELVGRYMCGTATQAAASVIATGTDGQTVTDEDFGYNEGM